MPDDRTTDPRALDAAARAVAYCEMPSGDCLFVFIHASDLVRGDIPPGAQMAETRAICRAIAQAAVRAYLDATNVE